MTVSRVLRGNPSVSDDVRDRVMGAAKAGGYVPRADARSLRERHFNRVACVVIRNGRKSCGPTGSNSYVDVAAELLAEKGYSTIFEPFCLDPKTADFMEPPQLFSELSVDGVLAINGAIIPQAVVDRVEQMAAPVVWVNQPPSPGMTAVAIDEVHNARTLTRHLIELGHNRIDYFGPPTNLPHYSLTDRIVGVRAELDASGLDSSHINRRGGWGKAELDRMLSGSRPPTAIICYSEGQYHQLLHIAVAEGLRIPGDLSVCCFMSPAAVLNAMPSTSLVLPEFDITRLGVEILLDLLAGRPAPAAVPPLRGELRIGDTTAPPS